MPNRSSLDTKEIRTRIDSYMSTLLGLQAFRKAIAWRNYEVVGHHASYGRRMTPSKDNAAGADSDLTPDLVVQILTNLGYVVEAKRSLPRNQDHWHHAIEQVRKYDDNLTGWWTDDELIRTSNVVVLIWTKLLREFASFIESAMRRDGFRFHGPVSLVEFSLLLEMRPNVFLRQMWGDVQDPDIAENLQRGIPIPIDLIVGAQDRPLKFYDDPPVTEHTMVILWNDIFSNSRLDVEFDSAQKVWPIEVTVDELAIELQRLYGSSGEGARERTFPRRSWVRDALEAFTKLGLAERLDDQGRYCIKYKTTLRTGESGDLVNHFAKHRVGSIPDAKTPRQLALFGVAERPAEDGSAT